MNIHSPIIINGSTINDAARSFESIEDWVTGNNCCCDWNDNCCGCCCCWPFVTTIYCSGELLCDENLLIFDAWENGMIMQK